MLPPFVTVDELRTALARADDADLVLADARSSLDGREGEHTYRTGHLPGAVFVDLETDVSAPPSPAGGRHPLPDPETFAAALGRRGIGPRDRVVAYDTAGGAIAARLVWMLRATGQDAAVLVGGLAAWDGPLETGDVRRPPVHREPVPWPRQLLADADEVAAVAAGGGVVLDARAPERFRGEVEPYDARPGHVPGARNLPVAALQGADGRLVPEAERRALAAAVGALEAEEVVAYCGSGVTACFDLLALESVGVRGRLFPGSWSAWAADPDRPAATGDA